MRNLFSIHRFIILMFLACLLPKTALAGSILKGPLVQVTDAALGDFGNAEHPSIASLGNKLYAVWGDTRSSAPTAFANYEAVFATSTDGGVTWSSNRIISDSNWDSGATEFHTIAVSPDGTIYVAWYLERCTTFGDANRCGGSDRENDIRLAVSQDGGQNFELVTFWDGDDDQSAVLAPAIAVDPVTSIFYGMVDDYLTDETHDVYLRGIDPTSGDKWLLQLNTQSGSGRAAETLAPQGLALAARNSLVCAAWEDSRSNNAIYGSCSSDKGKNFSTDMPVSTANGFDPRLAISPSGKIHISYLVGDDLFVQTSSDQGKSWSAPVKLNSDADRSFDMDMTVDANGTVAVLRRTVEKALLYSSVDEGEHFSSEIVPGAIAVDMTTLGAGEEAQAVWLERLHNNSQGQIWSNGAILDASLPTTPDALKAERKDRAITLSWNPSSDSNGIAGYEVLRSTSASGPFLARNAIPVHQPTFTDVELDGNRYFYKIEATDGSGNRSIASNIVNAAATVGSDLSDYQGTIAFQNGNAIHVRQFANLAQDRTLAAGLRPYLSADGKRIFYYQPGNATILSSATDGGDVQSFFHEDKLTELYDLASNQSMIARVSIKEYQQFGNPLPCKAFEPRFGTNSGSIDFSQASAIVTDLALSPDGKWLLYRNTGVCNTVAIGYFTPKLCVANLTNGQTFCDNTLDYRTPRYAPDGKSVTLAADFSGQMEIWKAAVQTDGSQSDFVQLTSGATGSESTHPSWSSDGQSIIFQRDSDAGSGLNPQLYVVHRDGSGLRMLDVAGETPVWFAGTSIAGNGAQKVFLPLVQR